MGRLSRAFSRAKETDKQKEATAVTAKSIGKSPSPPPPTYEEAERQEQHTQHPPQPQTFVGTSQTEADFPSPGDCVAHLQLLECFYRLKQQIASTDGLFGISYDVVEDPDQKTPKDKNNDVLTLLAEKRWEVYLTRAAERFSRWRYSLEPNADYYTLAQAISTKGQVMADRVDPEKAKPFSFDAHNLPPIGRSIAYSEVQEAC
jgi:hypothetical protein